jgi:dethiobiotin synthetase
MTNLFVTGTDTGVGKTVLSALLTAALDAVYWKPVQTGAGIEPTDRERVARYAGTRADRTLPEAYVFDPPISPHLAARLAGTPIELARLEPPRSTVGRLVIEGAGGVLVPVTDTAVMADVMALSGAPVVVAARTALGTINHTLLTLEALRGRRLPVVGVVLVGEENQENRLAIEEYGHTPVVGWIPPLDAIDRGRLLEVYEQFFRKDVFRTEPRHE